jgi:hypothetical protein
MGWISGPAGALALGMAAAVAAADDGCGSVCPPGSTEIGRYGSGGWRAATVVHEDGGVSCVTYAPAGNAEPGRGLWLFVYPTHLRFMPEEPLSQHEFINISAGGMTVPMAVAQGAGFVPLSFPMFARAVGGADTLTVHLGVRRPLDAQEFLTWSMDGFADAFRRIAEACAFDPSPLLGTD